MAHIRSATRADCDRLGLITVTASNGAFAGVIPDHHLDRAWTPEKSASAWRATFDQNTDRAQELRVVEVGGAVVGFVWSCPWADTIGYDSSVRGLYVLPAEQGRGLGRDLVADAVSRLRARGLTSLEIGCVRENASCGFYRHLGGTEIGHRPAQVDDFVTAEILFGWTDSSSLVLDSPA